MIFVNAIPEARIMKIIASTTTTNKRFDKDQFSKLFGSSVEWVGLFDDRQTQTCLALAALVKDVADLGDTYINEIQAFASGAGYGERLLESILKHYEKVWLMSNIDGGQKLVDYYKRFGLEEYILEKSIWDGKPVHFFFTKDLPKDKICKYIDETYSESLNETEYEPPYTLEEIKEKYPPKVYDNLANDPVHRWRAETGIELIHKEPTEEELDRILEELAVDA